ncbi:iron ABC transporter permease [Brachybacterium sp. EF45031]|uniref:FecCD family ABC transporter permease n=1 Tax=Brachybacterium sillae TaxID=2810536 RepID=UPI00217E1DDB|nr:iron ABC transporter permease [Brachybacterium sillae]MCS6712112.1 iron ABC transporter permease [Brachybacterium sillae]
MTGGGALRRTPWLTVLLGLAAVAVAAVLSVMVGARTVPPSVVWEALTAPNLDLTDHVVVTSRLHRTAVGLVVGGALALAGAGMQGMTRNPLADPGLLGLNAGAAAAVAIGVHWLGISEIVQFMGLAFLGAGLGAVLVYAVASRGRSGATPVKLALAGAAVTAGLTSLVSALMMLDQGALDRLRIWQVGTLGARSLPDVGSAAAVMLFGAAILLLSARALNALALGDDAASGLGVRVGPARLRIGIGVVLLAGAAVALAGPIGFVGLVVPHAARLLVGADHRRLLPLSLVLGPILVLLADVLGRVIAPPSEVQVAVMTAVLGVPVFLVLVRSRKQVGL